MQRTWLKIQIIPTSENGKNKIMRDGVGQCSAEVNVESQSILFEYMLKYSGFIGTSNLIVVDIDAINNDKHSF